MKEFKRSVRRSTRASRAARLRVAASIPRVTASVLLSFSFILGGARAQSVTPQASGAQDQRGIRVKQDGQKTDERANQATPADEKARAARPELVLQTGYALFGPSGLRFSPDGRLLATFSTFGGSQVKLWDAATGHELRTLAVSAGSAFFGGGGVTAVAFSRDGRLIAAGATDGSSRGGG